MPEAPSEIIIREALEKDADALAILLLQLGYPQDTSLVIRKTGGTRRAWECKSFCG